MTQKRKYYKNMNTLTIKQIDVLLKKNLKGFATKDDVKEFVTKKDLDISLKVFATKDDLKDFAKKSDLDKFATRDDLNRFATKKDLKYEIEEAVADIIHAVEVGKADKESLEKLEERVKVIEDQVGVSAQ